MVVINKKTGKRYIILQENIINKSDGDEGQIMILYVSEDQADLDDPQLYVRDTIQFWNKFERE